MFLLSPARGPVVLHCLLASSTILAQTPPAPSTPADAARASPHAPVSTGLDHRSAFDGYLPFSDAPPTSWREANDTVRRRGGWKAHAEEAARPASATSPPAPTPAPAHEHGHGHGHSHPATPAGPAPAKERP